MQYDNATGGATGPLPKFKSEILRSLLPIAVEPGMQYFESPDQEPISVSGQWMIGDGLPSPWNEIRMGMYWGLFISFCLEWQSSQIRNISIFYRSAGMDEPLLAVGLEVQPSPTPDVGSHVLQTGYVVGLPVLVASDNPQIVKSGLVDGDECLRIGNSPVLFGVRSIYSFFTVSKALNMTRTASPGEEEVKAIWASYGNVIRLGGEDVNYKRQVARREVLTTGLTVPKARWTFVYKKFGKVEMPVNLIVQVIIDVARPFEWDLKSSATFQIETVFTEVDSNGEPVSPKGEDEDTFDWNMVFELFFVRRGDVIRALGVTTCIAILGIIWGYYTLLFDPE
jgi:hypothetical protein